MVGSRTRRIEIPTRWSSLGAFAGFTTLSVLWFSIHLAVRPGAQYISNGGDPSFAIWCLEWWPHAILHGLNPIITKAVWAPTGANLMWVEAMPVLSVLFAPVTLIFGPVTSYNVLVMLVPGFAGWTAFLLCRYLTRAYWPSIIGGFLFACSGFEFWHTELSHIVLTTAGALVPLIVLVIGRFLVQELNGRQLVVRLGPLVGLQLLTSSEIVFTTALGMVVGYALASAFVPEWRPRLRQLPRYAVYSYLFAGLLTAPFVYYLLTGFHKGSFTSPSNFRSDLLTFIGPASNVLVGGGGTASAIFKAFPGLVSQPEAYVGLPMMLLVGLFARKEWHRPTTRFLIVSFVLVGVGTLGPNLVVAGNRIVPLPWAAIDKLPLLDNVLPVRLSLYLELMGAVVVALWLTRRPRGSLNWLLPALAVLAILPRPGSLPTTPLGVPSFFTDSRYRDCLDPGETILPLPITGLGEDMIWQAENGFHFNMAGGFTGLFVPDSFKTPAGVHYVTDGYHLSQYQALDVKSFIKKMRVGAVVITGDEADFFDAALNRLATPISVGDVLLYNFKPQAPSCPGA